MKVQNYEKKWIVNYVSIYLATWACNNVYKNGQALDSNVNLYNNQPFKEVFEMAELAWQGFILKNNW
jgi:hypothetical protein